MRYPYIADLSAADAVVLVQCARNQTKILEYGVGGSTLLFAQVMQPGGRLVSLDTELSWIHFTEKKLADLGDRVVASPIFGRIDSPCGMTQADFIFVDGHDDHRRSFGLLAWPLLKLGGMIAFHDTRRLRDVQNVNALIEEYFEEVGDVRYNTASSNITLIYKRHVQATYENWNDVEKKEPWMYGLAEPPAGWPDVSQAVDL